MIERVCILVIVILMLSACVQRGKTFVIKDDVSLQSYASVAKDVLAHQKYVPHFMNNITEGGNAFRYNFQHDWYIKTDDECDKWFIYIGANVHRYSDKNVEYFEKRVSEVTIKVNVVNYKEVCDRLYEEINKRLKVSSE